MSPYLLLTFFPAVINLGLCVYVWSRNSEARENRVLALACLGLSLYCFRTFEVHTRPLETAELIFPILKFGPLLAGAALGDFLMSIARRPLLARRRLEVAVIYAPVVLFGAGAVFTDWFHGGMEVTAAGTYIPQNGPLSGLEVYFLLALLLVALTKAVRSYFSSREYNQRKQLTWSVSGIGLSVLSIMALLHLPEPIVPFARTAEFMTIFVAFSTNLIAATMSYAIARYGLAPSIDELRRREAEARARQAELQHQLLDARMREEHRRQEALEKELETAHQMQMALMPRSSPRIEGLSIAGRCTPASEVGGDYFQYFLRYGKLVFCVADATGHAMQAAIPVVMFSGILASQMELDSPEEELFGRLNRSLHHVLERRRYVCFVLGALDLSTRTLRLINSGCPYPFHLCAASGRVEEVRIDAYPLGINLDSAYKARDIQLGAGDLLVLCSDGLVEARSAAGEMFGFERAGGIVERGYEENLEADALLDRFADEVQAFTDGAALEDDMTCIVLRVDRAAD